MSDYYTVTGSPANRSSLSSAVIRSEFASLAAGFAKVAPYTGHSGEIVRINAGGTGQESVSFASLLLTNIVIAGSLSGVTSLSMAGALSGVTNLSMAGTITGTTDMTMSGTLNGVNIVTTGNTTLGNAVGDTLNVAGGSLQVSATGSVGIGGAPVQKFDVFNGHIKITDGFSFLWGDSSTKLEGNSTTDVFSVYTNTTERVRVDSSGRLLVGTTAAVGTNLQATGSAAITAAGGAQYLLMGNQDSGGTNKPVVFQVDNAALSIGTGTSWASSSGGALTTNMIIDANGNVGFGTATPSSLLGSSGTLTTNALGASGLVCKVAGTDIGFIGANAVSMVMDVEGARFFVLQVNSAERLRVTSGGLVGIGKTPTTYALEVNGDVQATNFRGSLLGTASSATTATTASAVSNALTAGSGLTSGGTFDGSVARTFAVDSASVNTAGKIVVRDGSGNFAAGTITAALSGNASTATALQTARNINGVAFDGTANISVNLNNALTAGSGLTSAGTFDGSAARTFAVDSTSTNTASKIVVRDASGNFAAGTITAALSGNASTATALQTARSINGVAFDGTGNISVNLNNALTAGSYLTAGGTFDGSAARTFSVDATSANTASKVVARDANGDFAMRGLTLGNTSVSGNVLDWYEEGTWTPVIQGATSAGAGTYSVQTGTYTRVGNRVFFSMKITMSAHTGTGNMQISGLPYNAGGTYPIMMSGYNYPGNIIAETASGSSLLTVLLANNGGNVENPFAVTNPQTYWMSGHYNV